MTSRFAFLVTLSCLGACQCFVPVSDEVPDAGSALDASVTLDSGVRDAGELLDGGRDAGPAQDAGVQQCQTWLDCPAPSPLPFCGGAQAACVNGFCLIECGVPDAGRTCAHPAGQECLTCDGQRECAACRPFRCRFDPQALVGTCPPPFDDFQAHFVEPFSGRCGAGIFRDGGFEGVWFGTLTRGSLIEIPALGGTCLASGLATQVPRSIVSCPQCTFMAEGCE